MSESGSGKYTIKATTKVLERVYFALERLKADANVTGAAVNEEIVKRFGAPLSSTHWAVLNRARSAGALDQVVTRSFDFVQHGRKSRAGKTRKAKPAGEAPAKSAEREGEQVTPDSRKHGKYLLAIWQSGRVSYLRFRTRKAAEAEFRKYLRQGIALHDLAVYVVEPITLKLSLS